MSAHVNQFEAELAAHAALSRREAVAPLRSAFWSTPVEIVAAVCGNDQCRDCEEVNMQDVQAKVERNEMLSFSEWTETLDPVERSESSEAELDAAYERYVDWFHADYAHPTDPF